VDVGDTKAREAHRAAGAFHPWMSNNTHVISGNDAMDKLDSVIQEVLRFRDEREWVQFHTPKNLATALSIEAGELQELMLWKTDKEVTTMIASADGKRRCAREIADVLIFAVLFCEAVGVKPIEAIRSKLEENATKYPVELAKGNATKYSHLKQKSGSRKAR